MHYSAFRILSQHLHKWHVTSRIEKGEHNKRIFCGVAKSPASEFANRLVLPQIPNLFLANLK